MRKSTFLWMILAAVCGIMLFHTSQKVNDGRTTLAGIKTAVQKEKETLRVLQAEWSYLNQPERLDRLARQYLKLQPMKNRQFISLADLDHLPQVAENAAAEEPKIKIQKQAAPSPLSSAGLPPVKNKSFVWSSKQYQKAGR